MITDPLQNETDTEHAHGFTPPAETVRFPIRIGDFAERAEAVDFACTARRLLHLEALALSVMPSNSGRWTVQLGAGFQRLKRDIQEFLVMWLAGHCAAIAHMRRRITGRDDCE